MNLAKLVFPLNPFAPKDPLGTNNPMDMINGWMLKKVSDRIAEVFFEDAAGNAAGITEDDAGYIIDIIEAGRKQGLEEMHINVSKELGSKIEASGTLPVEVPFNVSANLEKSGSGEYCIKVKYMPVDGLDRIAKLKTLYEAGTLTDEEFAEAKKKIIEKL